MSLNTVICSDVLTILGAQWCRIRQSPSAIDTIGIAPDSRLIGDCSCPRYLDFDHHPHGIHMVSHIQFFWHCLFQLRRGWAMAAMGHLATSHGCAFLVEFEGGQRSFQDSNIRDFCHLQETFHHSITIHRSVFQCWCAVSHRSRFRMLLRFHRNLQFFFIWLRICEMTPCWGIMPIITIITLPSCYHVFNFLGVDGLAVATTWRSATRMQASLAVASHLIYCHLSSTVRFLGLINSYRYPNQQLGLLTDDETRFNLLRMLGEERRIRLQAVAFPNGLLPTCGPWCWEPSMHPRIPSQLRSHEQNQFCKERERYIYIYTHTQSYNITCMYT